VCIFRQFGKKGFKQTDKILFEKKDIKPAKISFENGKLNFTRLINAEDFSQK